MNIYQSYRQLELYLVQLQNEIAGLKFNYKDYVYLEDLQDNLVEINYLSRYLVDIIQHIKNNKEGFKFRPED